jgi:two-component system, sensor histidine kinase PdtaS
MKIIKSVFLVLFLIISFYSNTQSSLRKIERVILNGDKKSSINELKKIRGDRNYNLYKRIIFKTASYDDYFYFVSRLELSGKSQHERFYEFIKRIEPPKETDVIDLDYVKLKWIQINDLRNDVSLDRATKENNKLVNYIKSFPRSSSQNVQLAKAYADIHEIVILDIRGKIEESKKISLRDIKISTKLKDTFLLITHKYYFNEYYVQKRQLENYINNCKEILNLAGKIKGGSYFYNSTIYQLIDAYIFKGEFDQVYIENQLDILSKDLNSRYYTNILYAKYLSSLETKDPAKARIFNKFGVNNILELCDYFVKDSYEKLNNKFLIDLHTFSADALIKDKEYEEAFRYLKDANILTRKIYSEDLSEILAEYQTQESLKDKEHEIQIEKDKNKFYFLFSGVVLGLLVVLSFLVFMIQKNGKILAVKNHENELLLKEIHHRIKNNFQRISSLLELQYKNLENDELKEILKEGQNRINAMSMIHNRLYQSNDISAISFKDYCTDLVNENAKLFNVKDFHLDICMKDVMIDVDTAIPLGLILNELTSNAFKYGLNQRSSNEIKICLDETSIGEYKLTFRDNGKGLQKGLNLENIKSLGLLLVKRLTKQLQGKLNYYNENGAVFEVTFKDSIRRSNID